MSDEVEKGLMAGFKEKIGEKFGKVTDIKDSVMDKLSDIKETTEENAAVAKELASYQINNMKKEGQFLMKIFQHKDMVLMKTDAVVIVLRKLGVNEEFFELFDSLTKEGYRQTMKEDIRNFPLGFGFDYPVGSLYFFQRAKYV